MRKIYYSETGGMCSKGNSYKSFKLFDLEYSDEKGKGFQYSMAGKRYGHFWCYAESSEEITDISDDILFSFLHGSSTFNVPKEDIKECKTFKELIAKSDFKYVTQQEIENSKKRDEIKTIEQIKESWEFLDIVGFSIKQARLCLEGVGFKISEPKNGEIGIHAWEIMMAFNEHKDNIRDLI